MEEKLIYQLLVIIKNNGNIWDIIGKGYEFGQIAHVLDELKERHYLFENETGSIAVTEEGKAYISGYEANQGMRKYSKWILPNIDMWHVPLSKTDVYIPKK